MVSKTTEDFFLTKNQISICHFATINFTRYVSISGLQGQSMLSIQGFISGGICNKVHVDIRGVRLIR